MAPAIPVTTRRTLILQLAFVLVLFVVLWLGLHALNPFIDTPAVKAWFENSLPFLSVDARDLLVRHSLQALVAAMVAAKAFGRLKPVASFVTQHWMPGFPLFLRRPDRRPDLLDSPMQRLTLVGRAKELAELNGFLTRDDPLSWWWLNGGAGSGKSRLALEWIRSLRPPLMPFWVTGFDAGLLEDYAGEHEWAKQSWKPRRPTVIVVDNAAERASHIVDLMEYLGAQSSEFHYPVRVLLVERSVPEELTKLQTSSVLYKHSYKLDTLNVSPLLHDDIRHLGRELGERLGRVRDLTDKEVQQVLDVSKGLPLFVILALHDLATHGEVRFHARDQLLTRELIRTLGKMREQGIDDEHLPLLALATFVRGLPWEAAKAYLQTLPSPKKTVLDRVLQEDTARAIPPMQPDILGELFLLKAFGDLTEPERRRFLRTAWQTSADSVGSMLAKVAMDFPDHPSLPELDKQPEHSKKAVWWGRVRVRLLGTGKLSAKRGGHYLQQLQALATKYTTSSEFQNILALGMASANYSYRASGLWDESLRSLRDLVEFARAHREQTEVQLILARAATDVLSGFGYGQQNEEIQIALQAQADLGRIERVRQRAEFQVTLAVAAGRSMKAGNWQNYKAIFSSLDDIGGEFPLHREIQNVVSNAALDALAQWYRDVLDTDPWFGTRGRIDPKHLHEVALSALKTLEGVASRDTPDSAHLHRNIATSVLKTLSLPIYNWERMELSLKILEAAAKRYPDDVEIQIQFVKGALEVLSWCVHFSQEAKKAPEMQDIVQRIKEIVPAHLQQREEIAKSFMAAETYLAKTA
jgi:hypothetical protein